MVAKHTLRILNKTGDTAVAWAPGVKAEEEKAEERFNQLATASYLMFAVPAPGAKPTQIRKFESTAPEIIAVPRYQGG